MEDALARKCPICGKEIRGSVEEVRRCPICESALGGPSQDLCQDVKVHDTASEGDVSGFPVVPPEDITLDDIGELDELEGAGSTNPTFGTETPSFTYEHLKPLAFDIDDSPPPPAETKPLPVSQAEAAPVISRRPRAAARFPQARVSDASRSTESHAPPPWRPRLFLTVVVLVICGLVARHILRSGGGAASAGTIWREPLTGMEFVFLPDGCLEMGSQRDDQYKDDRPQGVCVDGFWMNRHEVMV